MMHIMLLRIVCLLLCVFCDVKGSANGAASTEEIRTACGLLNVVPGDTMSQITKKYRRLAKTTHPDRSTGSKETAEEQFKKLNKAHDLLLKNICLIPKFLGAEQKQSAAANSDTSGDYIIYYDDTDDPDGDFDAAWADTGPKQKASSDLASVTHFSSEFVRASICWCNEEKSESGCAREWARKFITPEMRLCYNWLALMRYASTNNWEEVKSILKSNPKLVNLHDGQADALSLAQAAFRDASPYMQMGMSRVQEILISYGAVARFPHYNGGRFGVRKDYWY